MYTAAQKGDPEWLWNLPDEEFYAQGACHILAWTYLKMHPEMGLTMVYIRPKHGKPGHHVYLRRSFADQELSWAFDRRGWDLEVNLLENHYEEHRLNSDRSVDLIPVHQHLEQFCAWTNHRPPSYFLELPWARTLRYIEKLEQKPEDET